MVKKLKTSIKSLTIILFISLLLAMTGCSGAINGQANSDESSSSAKKENTAIESESQSLSEADNPQKDYKEISVDEAYKIYNSTNDYIFIDVRSEEEYTESHIKGALGIPIIEIRSSINKIPKNKILIIYCNGSGCDTSQMAAKVLIQNGFTGLYIMGGLGILEWSNKGYPVE